MVGKNDYARQDYFEWLCERVEAIGGEQTYWLLCKDLHNAVFTGLVPHDENREYDGIALRERYFWETQVLDESFDGEPCTMLEMLVALADRIDFELGDPDDDRCWTARYFWELIGNLGLNAFDDEHYIARGGVRRVQEILDVLINRTYDYDGSDGGLFPLAYPERDQREVEIWYQMQAYLQENYG